MPRAVDSALALVERHDFASGTSSKSSKLVHGGLRYLQQREVGLVYEALAERQVLRTTAPHLVRILPFLLPVFKGRDNLFDRRIARIVGTSMWLYDFTGGARIGKLHKKLTTEQAQEHMPSLRAERVAYATSITTRCTDDARLTLMIARTAADFGATIVNYASVVELRKEHGRCTGATVAVDGRTIEVKAQAVVNATGVWADDVARARRRHPPLVDPAREGRAHHGAVGEGPQQRRRGCSRPEGSPFGVRGAVGRHRQRRASIHVHRHH